MMVTLPLDTIARKWKEIRLSILKPVGDFSDEGLETKTLATVPPSDQPAILKALYSESRALGETVLEEAGRPLMLTEVVDILSHSGIACFSGNWRKESAILTRYLYRGECPGIPALFCCDYWREAARGLVEGLSPEIQYSRHKSLGHGNSGCLDYVFVAPCVDRKLGLVPTEIKAALEPVQRSFQEKNISLRLQGFCENTLYFEIERESHPLDNEEREIVKDALSAAAHEHFPHLKLHERHRVTFGDEKTNEIGISS